MNEAAFNHLIAILAAGDSDAARDYIMHFPKPVRAAPNVRSGLAARVLPEHMAIFERTAPWLVSTDEDDTADRIKRALYRVGREGLSMRELSRKVSGVAPAVIREKVQAMIDVREVHIERRRTGGASAEVFRLFDFAAGVPSANIMNDPGSYRPAPLE